ncbi:MAG: hypothetical protein IPN71_01590 [Fibrobacteres bacterium]|nr:hypothetical protein [Fibrobacterota bacterium]
MNRKSIGWAAMALALCGGRVQAAGAQLANVENHWLANTVGTLEGHIPNFLTDMVVWYPHNWQLPEMIVLTGSFWDEGGCGYCSFSEGKSLGKVEWFKDTIHSDRAWRLGKKCSIGNFWGRNFLDHEGPPPVGAKAPFVACDGFDTLRSVVDPSAVAFDMAGNLLVADNGPDQNVKIFSMTSKSPMLLRTFGDSGGVFAGSVPGTVGIRRFWGIRGLGVDSSGNIYVGNTGIPMQTMGGTDIRVFSGKDSSLLWQVQGLAFVNTADADPSSNGQDLYLDAKRMRMDYTQTPGKSWKFEAVTLDPFRYPFDPRLNTPMGTVWERRIQGKRFQYQTNMVGGFVYVARFEQGSEIGIPTAFICTYDDKTTGWGADSAPKWERNESNKRLRWYWVDKNGDGTPQKTEFGTYENWNGYNQAIDVDESGDIWLGGSGDTSAYFRNGGLARIRAGALNARGVPAFALDSIDRWSVPFTEGQGWVTRLKHVTAGDRLYLAEGANTWYSAGVHVYTGFTDRSRQSKACRINLGYDDNGSSQINLDQNTASMTLPFTFTADSEFVYVTYLDNGRYSRRRGEVSVYGARDCQIVGWMAPDAETGEFSGAVDLVNGINVAELPEGRKLVMVEEDGAGKVMAYRWCPEGKPCASTSRSLSGQGASSLLPWRAAPGRLDLRLGAGETFEVRDLSGRLVQQGRNASGEAGLQPISVRRGAHLLRILGGTQNREWVVPVP